jgi:steroid delta-isomerase-like uncharacterized protein
MTIEQNKDLVRHLFSDAMNGRDLSHVDRVIAPGFINHGFGKTAHGPEGFKEIIRQFTEAFPDMKIQLEEVIGEDQKVVTRGVWTGTHRSNFMGIPATGKHVSTEYIDIWRVEDGMCVENWVQMDIPGLMQQLGTMPK